MIPEPRTAGLRETAAATATAARGGSARAAGPEAPAAGGRRAWRGIRLPKAPTILIRWKLTIFYSAVLALTLSSFSLAVYVYMGRSLVSDIDRASQERAAQVAQMLIDEMRREFREAEALRLGILDRDQADLLRAAGLLKSYEPWRYAGVGIRYYDATGSLVDASDEFLTDPRRVPIDYNLVQDGVRGNDHRVILSAASGGGPFYSFSRPVFRQGYPWAIVEILTSLQGYNHTMERLARLLVLGTLLATGLAFFTGAIVTEAALRPIDAIARTAGQIHQERDLSRRIPNDGPPDEIGRLASTFNGMLDEIEGMFDRQRRFLADVSHELRTPLTTILGEVELMQRRACFDPEATAAVHGEAQRMSRMVSDLLLLARTNEAHSQRREAVELDALVTEVLRSAQVLAGPGQSIEVDRLDPVQVQGDPDQLKQLLLNLVSNALKHTPPGTRVRLSLHAEAEAARLEVADDGPGIPEADLPFVFDRFYRVDKARTRISGGSGLGLAIVRAIAGAHGGQVSVSSPPGGGTTFSVRLPRDGAGGGEGAAGPDRTGKGGDGRAWVL